MGLTCQMAVWQNFGMGHLQTEVPCLLHRHTFVFGAIDGRLGLTSENARRKTIMGIKSLGKVKAGDKTRKVSWDERSGDIYVEGSPGFFGGGDMKKIGITAKNSGDAMVFAKAWLEQNSRK